VRDLPIGHDPSNKLAALEQAMNNSTPILGLYYKESQPTMDDALDLLVKKAGGEPRSPRANKQR
jgi:hypothetical protein